MDHKLSIYAFLKKTFEDFEIINKKFQLPAPFTFRKCFVFI